MANSKRTGDTIHDDHIRLLEGSQDVVQLESRVSGSVDGSHYVGSRDALLFEEVDS